MALRRGSSDLPTRQSTGWRFNGICVAPAANSPPSSNKGWGFFSKNLEDKLNGKQNK